MWRNRLYYSVKPVIPHTMRLAVRRWFALRKRERVRDVWPIQTGSGRAPEGWPGWPEGKQFALVLTHDVEGRAGLEKCRRLMEVEKRLGLRSCFYFVPENGCQVRRELREELAASGFEVGVHDLHHDGKLFLRKSQFSRNARRINEYLSEWGAAGFRSAFMLRNLEWMHELNIQYDTSTFDTDPFEPQPEGQGTTFPFWVQRDGEPAEEGGEPTRATPARGQDGSKGYVELPYTLPQDSTLFLTLGEREPAIWCQKLDWIAKHGGMALVNVHPDYVRFEDEAESGTTYPVALYERFLEYALRQYGDSIWQVKPGELARWYRGTAETRQPRPRSAALDEGVRETGRERERPGSSTGVLAGKRAAVVLYSYYDTDPRPKREAEAMARAGMEVDVFCLRGDASQPWRERVNGVNIFRGPMKRLRRGRLTYALRYAGFLLASLAFVSYRTLKRRYQLVHVHNMPDVLVFSALLPRLFGAKVLLDLHDPMPELVQAKFNLPLNHALPRLLKTLERLSIAFAHQVITPNSAFKEQFVIRGCAARKIEVVMNSPEEKIFHADEVSPAPPPPAAREFVLMYHGLVAERHGLDLAVGALAKLRDRARLLRLKLHIYGEPTSYMAEVRKMVSNQNLEDNVKFHGFKPLDEIAQAITSIDLGIIPNRLTEFTAINLPTRIFEYLAMNKPVIVPRTKGIRDYFAEDSLIFFEPGDLNDLTQKIEWAAHHPAEVQMMLEKGVAVYREHRWQLQEPKLLGVLAGLLAPRATRRRERPVQAGPKRIGMVTYSNYEADNRVMRYAEELARRGDEVEVLAIKGDRSQADTDMVGRVKVSRIQSRPRKDEKTKAAYLLPILRFLIGASARLTWRHLRRPYDLVHVHNVPDFLVFAAWLPRLTGAKVILDIHDILPEFYGSKFKSPDDAFGMRMLRLVERRSARFANHVIISNDLWRPKYSTRTGMNGRCTVFINNVDAAIFQPRPRTRDDGRLIVLFPGGLQWHQGLDIGIRAFKRVAAELPNAEFHIYGDGNMKGQLRGLSQELGLEPKVRFFEPVPVHQVAEIMANADLGVVPKRADSFGNEAYSTKIMEFMALGVPVVVSSTKVDRYYFNDSVVRFFESGNADALAEAMLEVLRDAGLRRRLVANATAYAAQHSWDSRRHDYLSLVDRLIQG